MLAEPSAGTATILFTDLVGSTELRARLGDVVVDQLQRAHDELLTAAVGEHGGRLVKRLGDGILASFGAAADAVAASAAIQQAVDRANRRVDDARRLAVRIGLSAGDVSWDEGDCHGTPVVTAARLCDRADGGQVLCDDLVRGLARGRSGAAFRLVGEVELKGLSDPVVAYEIPWEPTAAGRAPLPAPLLSVAGELPFAGRDDERDALHTHWKSAQTEGRTVALVSGEPGVGKTRLSAELARGAHDEGAWVLVGRCDENIAAPFAPWIEMLRFAVTHAPPELLAGHVERRGGEITRLVPELARRVENVPSPRSVDPETERLALFDATVDLLASLAADAPAVLVLDDAHWADAASLSLLRHLVRHVRPESPILAIVTYRDTDIDRSHPLAEMIGDFRREPRVERITLRGIEEAGIRDLLTKAGGHELPAAGFELARTLAEETEGNPFFIGEILRHLIETGVLVQRDGQWEGTTSVEEAGIPEGIKDVVGRRLSRLSDGANDTLRTAAVIGRDFSLDLLAEVIELPEDAVLDHLEEAIGALRLVDEVSGAPGHMTFAHALVRSTLVDELSTTRRVRLHRKIGEALEQRPEASAAELAHHFAEAATSGVAQKAVLHARQAAQDAVDRLAYDEVVHFYDLALEALEAGDDDPATRSELLARRGFSHHNRGDGESGRSDALAAADVARKIGDAARLADAGIAYQGYLGHWAAPADPVAVDLMREGLAVLGPDDRVTRARVTAMLAHALVLVPGDDALVLAQEAERIAREVGDGEALAYALSAWAWALRGRGLPDELRRVSAMGIDHGMGSGRPDWELAPRYHLGAARVALGDLDGAAADYDLVGEIPSPLTGWAPVAFAASRATAEGRLPDAEALVERAFALGTALGATNDAIWCGQHTRIELTRGHDDEALTWAQRCEESLIGRLLGYRSLALAEAGDLVAAAAATEDFEREIQPVCPIVATELRLENAALTVFRLGDVRRAQSVRQELAAFAGQFLGYDTFLAGAAERPMGLLALVEGHHDDAVALLDHALTVVETLGLHGLTAQCRVDVAGALFARRGPGDADRARTLLDEALDVASALGLGRVTRDAKTLLAG